MNIRLQNADVDDFTYPVKLPPTAKQLVLIKLEEIYSKREPEPQICYRKPVTPEQIVLASARLDLEEILKLEERRRTLVDRLRTVGIEQREVNGRVTWTMATPTAEIDAQDAEIKMKRDAHEARLAALHAVAMKLATAHVAKIKASVDAAIVAELEAL